MTTYSDTPAGGYADPQGTPNLLRYWDGIQWTEHTNPGQVPQQQGDGSAWEPNVGRQPDPAKVQHQVQQQAGTEPGGFGGGSLFTEPDLVVNQKAKRIELVNGYSVFDQNGRTRLADPLLSTVVASALTVDTALKQDSRGLGCRGLG